MRNDEWVLKRFELVRFPGSFNIGFHSSVETAFVNYESRRKITYLWIGFSLSQWQLSFRVPLKRYKELRAV